MMILHTSSLLILLSAFQRSYSIFSTKDTRQGQAAPKPKQAATQRRDGDGAACPQLENWDSESHSVYPSARIYRNTELVKFQACVFFDESLKKIQSELLRP
jgi:hypothetical protein